jgi:hypothetical protein
VERVDQQPQGSFHGHAFGPFSAGAHRPAHQLVVDFNIGPHRALMCKNR